MARHESVPLRRYEPMSRLKNYSVEKGLTDPRGWRVVDAAGQVIGEVTDLVVDTDRMAAAYLEVELDRKVFGTRDERRILVPMARAEREGAERRLVVGDLTRSRITALFEARAQHDAMFWEQWWQGEGTFRAQEPAAIAPQPPLDRPAPFSNVAPAPPGARPGSADYGNEPGRPDYGEERRPLPSPERLTARGEIEDSRIGRPAEGVYRPPLGYPDEAPPHDTPRYRRRIDE